MKIINSGLFWVSVVATALIWLTASYYRVRFFLHMIQLEGYKNRNYINWLKEFRYKVYSKKLNMTFIINCILFIIFAITSVTTINRYEGLWVLYIIGWSILMVLGIKFKKEQTKKELVFTPRAKRLLITNGIINILELSVVIVVYLLIVEFKFYYLPVILISASIIHYLIPKNMILANIAVRPIEKRINKYYYDKAYEKVRSYDNLKVVGITGSYGKTSTKFITASVLETRFNVLKTPESYNTPMGISKVINNTLNQEHEVFVVEMGARNIGDIEEVAKLANPQIGVLTSIGPTHLETFKNIENIMKTKYELIEELPADGIAIFNYDNTYIKRLADKTFKEKILYGMEDVEVLDIYATDIEVGELGSTFILNDKEGNRVKCKAKLLGKHNISNLLAGAAVGKALGLSLEEIARGIEKVEPIPHRLQLINPGTGVIVIDDAFNSNPVGAKAALDVISQFKEGRKIIVTPGMVELGDKEKEANEEFGRNIAKTCDYAILIGKNRTKPIYDGIISEGFNKQNLFVVNSLNEATIKLQEIVKPKDVVLFENDLPDTYNE